MQAQSIGTVKSSFLGRLVDSISKIGNNRRLERFEQNQALIEKIKTDIRDPEIIRQQHEEKRAALDVFYKKLLNTPVEKPMEGVYIPNDQIPETAARQTSSTTWITEPKFWGNFVKRIDRPLLTMKETDFGCKNSEFPRGYHRVKVGDMYGVLHVTRSSTSAVLFHEGEFHAISSGSTRFGVKNRLTNITEERASRFLGGH